MSQAGATPWNSPSLPMSSEVFVEVHGEETQRARPGN